MDVMRKKFEKKGQAKKNGALSANKGSNFGGDSKSREAARHRSGWVREKNSNARDRKKEVNEDRATHEIEKFQERKKREEKEREGKNRRGLWESVEVTGVKNALEATPAFWLSHTILFNLVKMRIQPVECLTTGWFGIRRWGSFQESRNDFNGVLLYQEKGHLQRKYFLSHFKKL